MLLMMVIFCCGRGGSVIEYEEIKPWVWRQVGGSQTLAVQVEGGKVVRVGDIPLLAAAHDRRSAGVRCRWCSVLQRFSCWLVLAWPLGAVRR